MAEMVFELEALIDVGFTGTQDGMTEAQKQAVRAILQGLAPGRFHHGCCIGADEEAHYIARELGYLIHHHPPTKRDKMARLDDLTKDVVYGAKDYMARNTDIAKMSRILIATPKEYKEQQRSGTWATVRRGRRYSAVVVVVYPDGSYEIEFTDGYPST